MGRPIGRDTVTIVHAPTAQDSHGNAALDWASATKTPVPGCDVQPGGGYEMVQNRDYTLIAYTVCAPISTAVAPEDRVTYNGTTYDVFGQPSPMRGFTPHLDYMEIHLQLRKG